MSSLPHFPAKPTVCSSSDLLRSSFARESPLRALGLVPFGILQRRKDFGVVCMKKMRKVKKHDYPWPEPKGVDPDVKKGVSSYLSEFKPFAEKPKPMPLPFEKPLMDLEKKIIDASF